MTFIGCQEPDVSCGVGMHSSLRIFNFHNSSETVAALALQCPQMLLQASNDPENTKANGDVHRVLQELPIGGACVFREFPEMMHGWVPRGNLGDDLVVRDVKAAMAACISFINEYVRKDVTCCLPLPFNG